jgi:hypothetical protein
MINRYSLQKERLQQQMEMKLALANAIQRVPHELQPKQHHRYPEDNFYEFERWFKDSVTAHELAGKGRTYLPIMWTAFWCNNGYGSKDKHKRMTQRFVDSLPRNKKYFTIVQYDDGCMVDFKDLDIKIFGMSGGRIDYPLPLLCCPHKFVFPNIKKDIFCSFVGSDTHPIRKELVKEFAGKKDCLVTFKKHSLEEYCKILARSVFALYPRGYGSSSFRIAESLQYSATPVYISDCFVKPYNRNDFVCIDPHDGKLSGLYDALKKLDNQHLHNSMNELKELFTYEGCKKKILENI